MYIDLVLLKHVWEIFLPQTEKDLIQYHLLKIRCPDGDTFNRGDVVSAQAVFDKIRKKHCLWIPGRERRMSFKDVVYGKQGNWYKCSKGKLYYNLKLKGKMTSTCNCIIFDWIVCGILESK